MHPATRAIGGKARGRLTRVAHEEQQVGGSSGGAGDGSHAADGSGGGSSGIGTGGDLSVWLLAVEGAAAARVTKLRHLCCAWMQYGTLGTRSLLELTGPMQPTGSSADIACQRSSPQVGPLPEVARAPFSSF